MLLQLCPGNGHTFEGKGGGTCDLQGVQGRGGHEAYVHTHTHMHTHTPGADAGFWRGGGPHE